MHRRQANAGGWRVNLSTFLNEKKKNNRIFQIFNRAQIAYKISPIKFYKE